MAEQLLAEAAPDLAITRQLGRGGGHLEDLLDAEPAVRVTQLGRGHRVAEGSRDDGRAVGSKRAIDVLQDHAADHGRHLPSQYVIDLEISHLRIIDQNQRGLNGILSRL